MLQGRRAARCTEGPFDVVHSRWYHYILQCITIAKGFTHIRHTIRHDHLLQCRTTIESSFNRCQSREILQLVELCNLCVVLERFAQTGHSRSLFERQLTIMVGIPIVHADALHVAVGKVDKGLCEGIGYGHDVFKVAPHGCRGFHCLYLLIRLTCDVSSDAPPRAEVFVEASAQNWHITLEDNVLQVRAGKSGVCYSTNKGDWSLKDEGLHRRDVNRTVVNISVHIRRKILYLLHFISIATVGDGFRDSKRFGITSIGQNDSGPIFYIIANIVNPESGV